MSRKMKGGIVNMCNFSEAILERGIEQGIEKGIEQGIEQGRTGLLVDLVQTGRLNLKEAAEYLGISPEKFEEKMKEESNSLK